MHVIQSNLNTRGDAGVSLVEFAIIVPLFLMLIVGVFDFERIYSNYMNLVELSRTTARFVASQDPLNPASNCQEQATRQIQILKQRLGITASIHLNLAPRAIRDTADNVTVLGTNFAITSSTEISCRSCWLWLGTRDFLLSVSAVAPFEEEFEPDWPSTQGALPRDNCDAWTGDI